MNEAKRNRPATEGSRAFLIGAILFFLLAILFTGSLIRDGVHAIRDKEKKTALAAPAESAATETAAFQETEEIAAESEVNQEEMTAVPLTYEDFAPHAVDGTEPTNYITTSEVLASGNITSSYSLPQQIRFGVGSDYAQLAGILTFRGNHFRSSSSYGTAQLQQKSFGDFWTQEVSSLAAPDGNYWSGTGWTGQPLIVSWPKATRQVMNLHDWAKEADALTEVIYATMDGNVYFLDLATGKQTRDPLFLGYTCKGSGSLDPRGYPILYVGAGYDSSLGSARAFAISLLDFSILFDFGADDSFALRNWSCFDSSPLLDAETDQLIYPGENGILYLVHLNTAYDETAGTLTMQPETVRWRYQGTRSSSESYWLGMEDSAVIWQGHLIVADNGGNLMCLDLDTLELDWVQDVLDDTNCSPVLELENGHPYVYISTSFHLGWRSSTTAEVPIYKIDAETGEILWEKRYACYSEDGVSGGVQGTIGLGEKNVSDLIYVPVARTGSAAGGLLSALNKETGEVVWELETEGYSWGSPTVIYDATGNGYVIFASIYGTIYLVDGKNGTVLDTMDLGAHVESTAAVYENTVVIGTRTNYIYGITLE